MYTKPIKSLVAFYDSEKEDIGDFHIETVLTHHESESAIDRFNSMQDEGSPIVALYAQRYDESIGQLNNHIRMIDATITHLGLTDE